MKHQLTDADNMADIPSTPKASSANLNTQTQQAYTQSLPGALRGGTESRTLEGQITRHNNDGTTRIKTNQGQLDVRITGDKPDIGTKVRVEITPRARGEAQIRIQIQNAAQNAQNTAPKTPPQTAPTSKTPLPQRVELPPSQTQTTQTAQQAASLPKTLQVGDGVRLSALPVGGGTPMTSTAASSLTPQSGLAPLATVNGGLPPLTANTLAALPNMLTAPLLFSANIIAADGADQLIKILLGSGLLKGGNLSAAQTAQIGTPLTAGGAGGTSLNAALGFSNSALFTNGSAPSGALASGKAFLTQGQNLANTNLTLSSHSLQINARILDITPPSILQNSFNAEQITNVRPGQVIGLIGDTLQTAQGPRISVSLYSGGRPLSGPFLLPAGTSPLAAGTQLHMSILNTQQMAPTGMPLQTAQGLDGLFQVLAEQDLFTQDLKNILDALKTTLTPSQMQSALSLLPQAASPARMTSSILFFMAALKGGNFQQWLGERTTALLQNSQQNALLSRAERSFNSISRMFGEPVQVQGGEWRSLQLPLLFGPDLSRLQLHIRDYEHGGGHEGHEDDDPIKRVIIDFTMSRMGDMQIDSLLMNKRLETVLRAHSDFSSDMKQDLRRRYSQIMGSIGYQGQLDFQNVE